MGKQDQDALQTNAVSDPFLSLFALLPEAILLGRGLTASTLVSKE